MGFNDSFLAFLNSGGKTKDPKDEKVPDQENLPGKKKYIPPYTPARTPISEPDPVKTPDSNSTANPIFPNRERAFGSTTSELYKESLRLSAAARMKSKR